MFLSVSDWASFGLCCLIKIVPVRWLVGDQQLASDVSNLIISKRDSISTEIITSMRKEQTVLSADLTQFKKLSVILKKV